MNALALERNRPKGLVRGLLGVTAATALWIAIYVHLTDFADAVVAATGVARSSHLGDAIHFFAYDTPKVLLLLTGIVLMSAISLSAPKMLILRKVLKLPLIATFAGVVATGILIVGYVFNALL